MGYYLLKLILTAILVVAASEIAKRSSLLGAMVASVPIISVLAMIWLFIDTRSTEKVARFSIDVFWLVLPSLSFFVLVPLLLKSNLNFFLSVALSLLVMIALYLAIYFVLQRTGFRL